MRNYHHGDHWLPGCIEQRTGPVSFKVQLEDGRTRRHPDQVRNHYVEMPQELHTEPDTTIPTTVLYEPSIESPTDSGAATVILGKRVDFFLAFQNHLF